MKRSREGAARASRACGALTLASIAACVDYRELQVPQGALDPPVRSAILIIAAGSSITAIEAVDDDELAHGTIAITAHSSDDLFLLTYPVTLATLGLSSGRIELASKPPRRKLPPGGSVSIAAAGDRRWVRLARLEDSAVLDGIRIEGLALGDCERLDGCFRWDGTEEDLCEVPCRRPELPQPPAPPEAPRFEPCPPAWDAFEASTAATLRLVICEPPVRTGSCAPGQYQFIGDRECRVPGGDCAGDRWPAIADGPDVRWVRLGAAGDGSKASPFGTIAEAIDSLPDDGTVALSADRFREDVTLVRPVRITGACSNETVVSGKVRVFELGVVIDHLSIALTSTTAVLVGSGGSLELDGVVVTGGEPGIEVRARGRLRAHDLVVENNRTWGLRVAGTAASATVTNGLWSSSGLRSIYALEGARIELEDIAVIGSESISISAQSHAELIIHRALLERGALKGIEIQDASSATITDVVLRDQGVGIDVAGDSMHVRGSTLALERASIEWSKGWGIIIGDSHGTIRDVAVRGTTAVPNRGGEGLVLGAGNNTVERAWLEANRSAGLVVANFELALGIADVNDLVVLRTLLENGAADGINVREQTRASVRRAYVGAVEGIGLHVDTQTATDQELFEDLAIARAGDTGATVVHGDVVLRRATIDDAHGVGLDFTQVHMEDEGLACNAALGLRACLEDVAIGHVLGPATGSPCGAAAGNAVFGVAARGCIHSTLPSDLTLKRFQVATGNDTSTGVCAGVASKMVLSTGVIAENREGVLILDADLVEIGDDVAFEKNLVTNVHRVVGP